VQIKTSDDAATYSDWRSFVVGDYSARAFKFRLVLETESTNHNIAVTEAGVTVDMPDRIVNFEDVVSGAGSYTVTYPFEYYAQPAIGITAQNMQTGDYYTISNKTASGFDVEFKNAAGVTISRTFDVIAKGY
jgi:hypothetical protein